MPVTEQQLTELTAKHKRVKHVVYNGVDIVFRKPTRAECKQHAMALDNPQEKASADDTLALQLVVVCGDTSADPRAAREALLELLDEYPYLTRNDKVGKALSVLTGVTQDEDTKP